MKIYLINGNKSDLTEHVLWGHGVPNYEYLLANYQ